MHKNGNIRGPFVSLVKNLRLLIPGFRAFSQRSLKLPVIDGFINKHM